MTIPVRAGTYEFVPASLVELDAPVSFTLRHGTRGDKHELQFQLDAQGLRTYSQQQIQQAIISELREGWESEGLEQNITQLEAYWQAGDDLIEQTRAWLDHCGELKAEAAEGEEPELPPQPELDFAQDVAAQLDQMVEEVRAHSRRVSFMEAQNRRYNIQQPRMILAMLLSATTLEVELPRKAGIVSADAIDELLERLVGWCDENGADANTAVRELLHEARSAFILRGGEEKNSSARRSGSTRQKASTRRKSTSRKSGQSKTRKSSAKATG